MRRLGAQVRRSVRVDWQRVELGAILVAPMLLSAAVVLQRSVDYGVGLDVLLRPLIVVSLSAGALTAATVGLVRSRLWAGLIASAVSLLLLGAGPPFALALGLLAWWPALSIRRRLVGARPLAAPVLPARMNASFAVMLTLVSFIGIAGRALGGAPPSPPSIADDGATGGPSIYLLLLDGYPRSDTLSSTFAYDNTPFEETLSELGFTTYSQSRSNYTKTWLSLASLFNANYAHAFLSASVQSQDEQIRLLHRYVSHSAVLELLEGRGYDTWSIGSAFTNIAPGPVDHYLRSARATEFEIVLLQESLFSRLVPDLMASFAADQARGAVYQTLETFAQTAEAGTDGPRFVFAHVLSPHAPFVLGGEDPAGRLSPCFPRRCTFWDPTTDGTGLTVDQYAEGLRAQVPALNVAVISSLRRVIAADPSAVVIAMSDHGSRYSLEDSAEQFRNFLSIRSPGQEDLMADDPWLVNLFRNVFTEYFGIELEPLAYEAWLSDWSQPMKLTPMGDIE
jgi:hypothetical protein